MNCGNSADVYTAPCEMDRREAAVGSAGSSARCSVMTWGAGWEGGKEAQEREDTCVLRADPCCCTAETNTML